MSCVLGIDLGGTKLLGHTFDDDGSVVQRWRYPTGRDFGPSELLSCVDAMLSSSDRSVAAIGIGFPGLVDFDRGLVRSTVMLDGWREMALADELEKRTGLPTVVDNDVNMAAAAEHDARGGACATMIFVAIGTGIGGAIVIGGRLYRGATGVAGEVGNTSIDRHGARCRCGRRGCLNTTSSGTAIEGGQSPDEAAHCLGFGLANAVQLLNPELVVLGGGVAERGPTFLRRVAETMHDEVFPEARCRVERSVVGYDAAVVGAGLLARELRGQPGAMGSHPSARAQASSSSR